MCENSTSWPWKEWLCSLLSIYFSSLTQMWTWWWTILGQTDKEAALAMQEEQGRRCLGDRHCGIATPASGLEENELLSCLSRSYTGSLPKQADLQAKGCTPLVGHCWEGILVPQGDEPNYPATLWLYPFICCPLESNEWTPRIQGPSPKHHLLPFLQVSSLSDTFLIDSILRFSHYLVLLQPWWSDFILGVIEELRGRQEQREARTIQF